MNDETFQLIIAAILVIAMMLIFQKNA